VAQTGRNAGHLIVGDRAILLWVTGYAANVDLSGSSQVILSMMIGGTLTGSAIGSSHVGYYGNNITQQVRSANSAAVTWLGNTVN